MKKRVVIGCLGVTLDQGKRAARWTRWRPSVSVCQSAEQTVDRFELLYPAGEELLAGRIADDIQTISPETVVNAQRVELSDPWDFETVYSALYEWARSYVFKPETHDYLIHITTGTHVFKICWFLLAESRHIPAFLLQTSPPLEEDDDKSGSQRIIDLDLSRYDGIARRFDRDKQVSLDVLKSGIETRNKSFNRLIEQVELVATRSREPMLITGPTGAGKSQLASQIYALKRDRQSVQGAFVEVNCATLRGDSAMSALFGHIKGAYTGATNARPGLLKAADGGVLFLDEIGELGLDEQAMLLRAIEEKVFMPVGSDTPTSSDFQLLAGTNRDLWSQMQEGRFREDLLARINLWTIELPGLKDRLEDLEPNIDYELEQWDRKYGKRITINREARDRFVRFGLSSSARWTGNFRDLNAAITRMATMAPGGRIDQKTVDDEITRLERSWRIPKGDSTQLDTLIDAAGVAELDRFDRSQLMDVIQVCLKAQSLSEAGRILFAVSRRRKAKPNDADRLRKYLARFNLDWQMIKDHSSNTTMGN